MATRIAAASPRAAAGVGARLGAMLATGGRLLTAGLLLMLAAAMVAAILSYDASDPSLNTVTGAAPANWLGHAGAWFADLALQAVGPAVLLAMPALVVAAWRVGAAQRQTRGRRGLVATLAALPLAGAAIGTVFPHPSLTVPAGWGGLAGLLGSKAATALEDLPALTTLPIAPVLAAFVGALALTLLGYGSGLRTADGAALLRWLRRRTARAPADAPLPYVAEPRPRPRPIAEATDPETLAAPRAVIVEPRPQPGPGKRQARERQSSLDLRDHYALPSLDLLKAPAKAEKRPIDRPALEQNGRLLESVLDDFGVKGRIGEVRPGPVVTMYELEPAPGLKASRVIGLSDDIARSMSALSARVAVVPGRNVIGIELPNARREMVVLSELVASAAYDDRAATLPLVLGKNIAGDPVIVDLSPMPHLLIAGTTGSGKSVGLNCMILSLLYRLTPEQCRMIMIDPKMLELSVYDGIPHLLAPVVTEPSKAIRALKWATEEMEDRYRKMATINVRSLAGFNARVREAKAAGKPFERKVHTGYDADSDQPIYEIERLEFEPLPLIVVVVDELADLMMTAGKEVEFLIQRLAQKARAAGIHLIMATQRPSVDVITGVIKANLPTRISFQVTSKIDSRTILGEQGAEQLLGKGDMLYMPGGKQVVRVHGPFVGDDEVERVADHWRGQGRPDYLDAVTEDPPEGGGEAGLDLAFGGTAADSEDDLYRRAVAVVAESRKASTSYVQRQLRIGYNSAARLIEKMEKAGVVGPADHVGRREVLVDESGR